MPAYAQPPSQSPSPAELPPSESEPRKVWYGWQTLIVAGASLTTGGALAAMGNTGIVLGWPPALGGLVFGGPIVHWAHGRVGRGFAVLGMNMGAAGAGLAGFGLGVACAVEKCDGFYISWGILGSYIGAAVAVTIDVAALSTYRPPARPATARAPRALDSLAPMIDVRKGRTVLGLTGTF